jgi:hypothetical protein
MGTIILTLQVNSQRLIRSTTWYTWYSNMVRGGIDDFSLFRTRDDVKWSRLTRVTA